MAHFAKLDENNNVLAVHVVNNDVITIDGIELEQIGVEFLTNLHGHTLWKQTSYNATIRKNYAGIGYYYDSIRDAFIPSKPYPSWILNEDTCLWESPIPYPNTTNIPIQYRMYNIYIWNETNYYWELKKPYNSWTLHEDSYYISPIPYPNDGNHYNWDEETLSWDLVNNL